MNKFFKVAVWFAVGVAASSSAFASGFGPAPHYSPLQGAPASQQGPGAIVADAGRNATANDDMGGMADQVVQSGARTISGQFGTSTFKHH
ncbi:hypothetical protein ACFQ3P_14920 [Paraburkholderia sabiae]|jgi:hypothetical protein|uniref:Uncharacterized protein n=1 Tax=Paraburkholderia sabiae TaxID=273251 RepID=A0ABU9Q825_9BURK|nr:hypothetical protein [Paraburkholderia sabiae]WJZ77795.1 hypothetical protein QEN71_37780 [Paraburkholderia sabiae]CAD6532294.1 hypothetical protein LMG24235_02606 [Paraburkholderia sabiae]CAG9234721.1 conserved exported hypothetical protein [Paraburkholderia sabiae]